MNVTAYDPDTDALLEYSLAKPFYITDRRGFTSKSDIGNYSDTFRYVPKCLHADSVAVLWNSR